MAALALLLAAWAAASTGTAAEAPLSTATVTLSAVGDIRLDGPIARIAGQRGPGAPSADVLHLLKADIAHANLETPVTARGAKTPKTWNFRAHPRLLPILKAAGFDVLTIANNHVWDYGAEGFLDTLNALREGGWTVIGGGKDREEAERVRVLERKGLRVGFVGLTSTHPKEGWARPGKPGVAYSDFARVPGIVKRAKERCDVLVVSFHGGTELAAEPNEIQQAVARAAVDAGADLFIGHHPHVLQPVELHKGKPIVYSLGNFLFVSPTPSTRAAVVLRAQLGLEGVRRLEFHPVDGNWGRLKPAEPGGEIEAQARAALDALGALSAQPERLVFVPTKPGS